MGVLGVGRRCDLRRLGLLRGSDRNDLRQAAQRIASAGGSRWRSGWRCLRRPWHTAGHLAKTTFRPRCIGLHWWPWESAPRKNSCGAAGCKARWHKHIRSRQRRVLAAAGSHAAYKTALFVFPPDGIARQTPGAIVVIAGVTFGFGAVLGLVRLRQGTIAAPVAFHVLFDLLVYGQYASAPWWVW